MDVSIPSPARLHNRVGDTSVSTCAACPHRQKAPMKQTISRIACIAALALYFGIHATGAASAQNIGDRNFQAWLSSLLNQVASDPQYRRLPLNTPEQTAEFTTWMHLVYARQLSGAQFYQLANAKYPGHQYELNFILSRMPK